MHDERGEANDVLVIDDEESLRHALMRHLRRSGFGCDAVATAHAGIERFASGRYAAVLTDVRLPDLGGLDVLAALLELAPEVPVIVMTGYASLDTAREAMRRGAADFLEKPFSMERVAIVVARAVGSGGDANADRALRARMEREFAPERYDSVAKALREVRPEGRTARSAPGAATLGRPRFHDALRRFEVGYLEDLLARTRGNVTEAARLAGITRTNLHKKIKSLRLDLAGFRRAVR